MGKGFSMLSRKMNRFNVENRAHRHLDKDKRPSAPWHPSTKTDMKILEDSPKFMEEQSKKDAQLDDFLKRVYVTSSDVTPLHKLESTRPLPQSRITPTDYEFGFYEPDKIPEGFCTLRQAVKFISDHQGDPQLWSAANIAKEYKIDEQKIVSVLEYFKTFNVYVPELGGVKPSSVRAIDSDSKEAISSPPDNDKSKT